MALQVFFRRTFHLLSNHNFGPNFASVFSIFLKLLLQDESLSINRGIWATSRTSWTARTIPTAVARTANRSNVCPHSRASEVPTSEDIIEAVFLEALESTQVNKTVMGTVEDLFTEDDFEFTDVDVVLGSVNVAQGSSTGTARPRRPKAFQRDTPSNPVS